ncbi:MAG: SDR family NAD(P)-dependent oxidoreductase [Lachnospiraceae bacterium]|nr:SDR family NAD(P)-dependent oxidoreductase [Lachnospiraceae bacterium]
MRKQAMITGASRGIGKMIAQALGKEGYDLTLTCASSFALLQKQAAEWEKAYGIRVQAFQADVGSYEEMKAVFEQVERLDLLVNNAGISHVGLLSDMTKEEWERILAVNLSGLFHTCKFAVPKMVHDHSGRIINISSMWGNVGASMEVAYSATKGGVNSFTKALAKELAPSNIAVNAIACGVVDTDMNKCFSAEDMEALRQEIPADRIASPEEIAEAVVGLTKMPLYMTGQILTIDGGYC